MEENKVKLSDDQKLICKAYGIAESEWSSLYDEADALWHDPQYNGNFKLEPLSIPALLSTFDKEKYVQIARNNLNKFSNADYAKRSQSVFANLNI